MINQFFTTTVPGKFTVIRCRRCNQSATFCSDNLETKIENFKADHAHEPPTATNFNKDRFFNSIIGKFGE